MCRRYIEIFEECQQAAVNIDSKTQGSLSVEKVCYFFPDTNCSSTSELKS
uniref:Uncharacterized protein n=1 Tax=Arion vulgaris TaxID=1028688 RepID=A0A0B6YDK1_9EUPU